MTIMAIVIQTRLVDLFEEQSGDWPMADIIGHGCSVRGCGYDTSGELMAKACNACFQRIAHLARPDRWGRGSSHEVETLQCGLLGREVSAVLDRPPVAGVETINGICGADHASNLHVVVQEGHEF